jgi:PAS domain S-box-containing protein
MTEQGTAREQQLAALFRQIAQELVSSLDLRDTLSFIVDQAMAFLDADVAILRLLDRPGEQLEVQVVRGIREDDVRQVRIHPGKGLAGRLLRSGAPLRGVNFQQDPRATQRAFARRHGWKSFAGVALHLHKQPVGVWLLIRKQRKPFTEQDLGFLSAFADYASLGVERSRLLYTLVREKHESETLIQASANGILVVDGRGRVINMNPAMERLSGWTFREAWGEPCCDVVGCRLVEQSDETDDTIVCPLQLSEDRNRGFIEYHLHTREGRTIPVEASYGLTRDEDGHLDRLIMVYRDLSRQKEMDRMRAEIVANVSHELRTPLALIKGYASTLLSPQVGLDEKETRRFLKNASIAADRLGRMIDDLLCASRLETDQLRLRPEQFDLRHRLQQVATWFKPHARGRHLAVELPQVELPVWADPDRVEQVMVNLLTNAAKYSAPDSTITVRGQPMGDQPFAVVHVSDEGQGIAAEHLPRIFDRFYPADESRDSVGLGLYICKGLVEAMDGRIWLMSEVGAGSTFSFTLPARADIAPPVAAGID